MKPLRIRIVLDPARARVWHRRLADALRRQGHSVTLSIMSGGPPVPHAATLLIMLERLVYGRSEEAPGAAWTLDAQSWAPSQEPADVVLDMSGQQSSDTRSLGPVYAGSLLEEAAIAALLDGRIPEVGILDSAEAAPRMFAAAVERPRVLCKALDNLAARLETIFLGAIGDIAASRPLQGRPGAIADSHDLNLATALTQRARMALTSLASGTPHWFVGWRRATSDRIVDTMQMPNGWNRLPDDGARFYADPFLFQQNDRIWLFVEEFQYAVGKALISVVELGANGPIGTPRAIVERPYHLSYPFVFERDGEIWMLPEMSAGRRVELLRATNFPQQWESGGTLIESEEISDATIVEHHNRLWLFGTLSGGGASSWDALHLWSAQRLLGDWRPHARNPVLIDARSARPAGALYRRGSGLWRPAQDCTRGYGSGLTLARVTKLDDEGFEQEVAASLHPGPSWPGIGLHTLNAVADFEVIDGATAGRAPKR